MGPITIFDKSALQALSMDEAVWFDAFFYANVVPVFYVETLADLEKEVAGGRAPEDVVGMLAEKTPYTAVSNVHHRQIVLSELAGGTFEKAMTIRQPVIGGGDTKQAADGSVGVHFDEFPEAAALLRWRRHEFLEIERAVAKDWREELAQHDPARLISVLQNIVPTDVKISGLEQLKTFIDSFCSSADPEVFAVAFDVLAAPTDYRQAALHRWLSQGQPPLDRFAPYTTHVFKVDLLFYLGILRGFISGERASNKVDMAYLYYLPFAMVFVSGDRLHHRTVPLFLGRNQTYVQAEKLTAALRELDEYYDALPNEIKELGVLRFASYPPSGIDNAVTRQWTTTCAATGARAPKPRGRTRKTARRGGQPRTVATLNRRVEETRPVLDQQASLGESGPDYIVIRRQMPATKGKWRLVSKEVEDTGGEN